MYQCAMSFKRASDFWSRLLSADKSKTESEQVKTERPNLETNHEWHTRHKDSLAQEWRGGFKHSGLVGQIGYRWDT